MPAWMPNYYAQKSGQNYGIVLTIINRIYCAFNWLVNRRYDAIILVVPRKTWYIFTGDASRDNFGIEDLLSKAFYLVLIYLSLVSLVTLVKSKV